MSKTGLGISVSMLGIGIAATLLGQETGSIQGIALDPAGKPTTNTLVRAIRIQPTRWTSREVLVDGRGGFVISPLAPGEYMLCAVTDPAKLQVDPCFWLEPPKKPIVVGRGAVTGQRVQMDEGEVVTVRLKDPKGILRNPAPVPGVADARSRVVTVEFVGPPGGMPRSFLATATEPGGVEVRKMLAPKTGPGRLRIHGQAVALKDNQQRAIPGAKFEGPPGQADHEFEIE